MRKKPIIDITDLYHPHQDPGDNFDIIMPYALPEIDLKAVILDATWKYRQPYANHDDPGFDDPTGPRDPGIIPMTQMNYIFGRNVPFAVGPFRLMRSEDDKMEDVPPFQQQGIELILNTLRASDEKVDILCFGSLRTLAAAYNRDPGLLRDRVGTIHMSAGASSPDFVEWNVKLDPLAVIRLLRSDLPIAVYPCATENGPFAYGPHNSFWMLPDLSFIERMHPVLKRYLGFAFGRLSRTDYLRAMDEDLPAQVMQEIYPHPHKVWETAVWIRVSGRKLVRRSDGTHRIVPDDELAADDTVLPNELLPCTVQVRDTGAYSFELTDRPTNFRIYDRGNPYENERALIEALPELYQSFDPYTEMKAIEQGA